MKQYEELNANSRNDQAALAGMRDAELVCAQRGVRFTSHRRAVLEMLWRAGQPVGAYDLKREMEVKLGRPLSPPTVYRALEFLLEQGLASRIETRNAFVPHTHPNPDQACVFFICQQCGSSSEVENQGVDALFERDAQSLGFRIGRRVVEMQGTCVHCLSESSSTNPANS